MNDSQRGFVYFAIFFFFNEKKNTGEPNKESEAAFQRCRLKYFAEKQFIIEFILQNPISSGVEKYF